MFRLVVSLVAFVALGFSFWNPISSNDDPTDPEMAEKCLAEWSDDCLKVSEQWFHQKEYDLLFSVLDKGCATNHPSACTHLGFLYKMGKGVEQNAEKALSLYQVACDGGSPQGCVLLGQLYQNADGVEQDLDRAKEVFTYACDEDNPMGCTGLASTYSGTGGVGRFLFFSKSVAPQVISLYRKACALDYPPGCLKMGDFAKYGFGQEKSLNDALVWYQKGCNAGFEESCREAENMAWRIKHDAELSEEPQQ